MKIIKNLTLFFLIVSGNLAFNTNLAKAEYLISRTDGKKLEEKEYQEVLQTIYKYATPTVFNKDYFNELTESKEKELEELKKDEEKFIRKKISSDFKHLNIQIDWIPNTLYQIFYLDLFSKELCSLDQKELKRIKGPLIKLTKDSGLGIITQKEAAAALAKDFNISMFPLKDEGLRNSNHFDDIKYNFKSFILNEQIISHIKNIKASLSSDHEKKQTKVDSCGSENNHPLLTETLEEDLKEILKTQNQKETIKNDPHFFKEASESILKQMSDRWSRCSLRQIENRQDRGPFYDSYELLELVTLNSSKDLLAKAVKIEAEAQKNNELVLFRGTNGFNGDGLNTLDAIQIHSLGHPNHGQPRSALSYGYELLSGGFFDASFGAGAMALKFITVYSKYGYALKFKKRELYTKGSRDYILFYPFNSGQKPETQHPAPVPPLQGLFSEGERFHPRVGRNLWQNNFTEEMFQRFLKERSIVLNVEKGMTLPDGFKTFEQLEAHGKQKGSKAQK